jgi:hypothetical protein
VTTFRRKVELQAGPLVILLSRLPRAVPFLAVAGLLIGGLLVQGVLGAVLLLVLALLLGTLLLLSWPALQGPPRALRSLVVAALVARAATFLL